MVGHYGREPMLWLVMVVEYYTLVMVGHDGREPMLWLVRMVENPCYGWSCSGWA